jgi:DNA-binding CsgD family transcriptional regulator
MAALIAPDPLQRLIEREAFAEIVALLQPLDLVVAAMRLEGLTDGEIAALLGVTRASVSSRMRRAGRRIVHLRPDLAPLLEGRRPRHRPPERTSLPPLERGWLCAWDCDAEVWRMPE